MPQELNIASKIAKEISVWIMTGEIEAGERLPTEHQLQERFSVSRPTIRAALKIVAGQGLTQSIRGSGHTVLNWWNTASPEVIQFALEGINFASPQGRTLVTDLLEARKDLACLIVEKCAARGNETLMLGAIEGFANCTDARGLVFEENNSLIGYAGAQPNLVLRMAASAVFRTVHKLYDRLEIRPENPAEFKQEFLRVHQSIEMNLGAEASQMLRAHLSQLDIQIRRTLVV